MNRNEAYPLHGPRGYIFNADEMGRGQRFVSEISFSNTRIRRIKVGRWEYEPPMPHMQKSQETEILKEVRGVANGTPDLPK